MDGEFGRGPSCRETKRTSSWMEEQRLWEDVALALTDLRRRRGFTHEIASVVDAPTLTARFNVVGSVAETGFVCGGAVGVKGVGVGDGLRAGASGDLFERFSSVRIDAVDDAHTLGNADALAEGILFTLELGIALCKARNHDGGVFGKRRRDDVEFPLTGKIVIVGLNV